MQKVRVPDMFYLMMNKPRDDDPLDMTAGIANTRINKINGDHFPSGADQPGKKV